MRSKSEKIIADLFGKNNIPYVYEPRMVFQNGHVICPDFFVLNIRLRKTYVFEHLGLMSDHQYAEKTNGKLTNYIMNGYFPGKNLLFSMETQEETLNTKVIEKMIREYLV